MFFGLCRVLLCNTLIDYEGNPSDLLYSNTAIKLTTNTNLEVSQLSDSYIGTKILPINFFSPGKILRIRICGYLSTGAENTTTLRLYLAGGLVLESTSPIANNLTDAFFEVRVDIICYTQGINGTIRCAGRTLLHTGTGLSTVAMRNLMNTSDVTTDTTKICPVDVTYQWGTALAANKMTILEATLEKLG